MRLTSLCRSAVLVAAAAVCVHLSAHAQYPVQFQYTCPSTTGALPTCTTTFYLPAHKHLLIQNVSGSATPINPNAAGNFATDQANLTISTQMGYGPVLPNIVGPHYAVNNSAVWNFNNVVFLYSDTVPVVQNNGGSVYLQGLIY